jgi:hypothetical protein
MVGLFVGGALVTLAQYFRLRERRLLPIAVLLALGAVGQAQDDVGIARRWHAAAGACALALAVMLSAHHRPAAGARAEPNPRARDARAGQEDR